MSIIRNTTRVIACTCALPLALAMAATALATAPARAQGSWVAPERAAHRANTLTATPDAVARGHEVFHRDCETCHGKAGHGDGQLAGSLNPHPADLASARVQSQLDGALFWKITEGRGMMPRLGLNENEKWAVVNYIRTLSARP